jgi:hypothetical protein
MPITHRRQADANAIKRGRPETRDLDPKGEGFKASAAQPSMRELLRENAGTSDASASGALDASRS